LLPPLSAFFVIKPLGSIGLFRHLLTIKSAKHPLLRFFSTSASSSRRSLPLYSRPTSLRNPVSKSSLLSQLIGLSAFPDPKALLVHFPFEEASRNRCPGLWKSHPRVWLPSRCGYVKLSNPGRPLSAPNAPRLLPSKLFSHRMIEEEFPLPSPLLRFPKKPRGLLSTLQWLTPTR